MAKQTVDPLAQFQKARAEDYLKHRLIGLSAGEPGSRKTSFWLEAPGPIVLFSLDRGLEGVVNRILDGDTSKDIRVVEYDWCPTKDEDLQQQACDIRDTFASQFEVACTHARTVILDKEGDLWSLYRYAEFGPEQNDAPRNYPALNQRYRKLISMAKASDANFGFIDGMKDQWGEVTKKSGAKGAASTGLRIRSGFGELAGLVHLEMLHTGLSPKDWAITVGKSRGPGGADIAGQTFTHEEVGTFQQLASLIFPDSDESDWR